MAKTTDKVYDAADSVKPYVQHALHDEKLRDDVMSAFATAKELYTELVGGRGAAVTLATRVATDDEVRDKLREAIDDLRSAADRLQGRKSQSKSHTGLLVAGIALGILFNPVTGPETRRWLKDMISGGGDDFGDDFPASNGGV
ncbi:MAG TPA: hypothetical protein VNR59_02255 [Gaiellaceae bacterium]|nr:hypothetical protein [Gaiellaceae bacterium]